MTNKKQIVKMLLELISQIPQESIPTTSEHSMDMKKFHQVPEVAAVITLLKFLKVDSKWLVDKGFVAAGMVLSGGFEK